MCKWYGWMKTEFNGKLFDIDLYPEMLAVKWRQGGQGLGWIFWLAFHLSSTILSTHPTTSPLCSFHHLSLVAHQTFALPLPPITLTIFSAIPVSSDGLSLLHYWHQEINTVSWLSTRCIVLKLVIFMVSKEGTDGCRFNIERLDCTASFPEPL